MTVEQWKIAGKQYTAYIGNIGQRSNLAAPPALPTELFPSIEKAILQLKPLHEIAWYKVFFCDIKGEQTFEALQDNEEWPNGLNALKNLSWPASSGYYIIRNFIILKIEQNRGWSRIGNYFKN